MRLLRGASKHRCNDQIKHALDAAIWLADILGNRRVAGIYGRDKFKYVARLTLERLTNGIELREANRACFSSLENRKMASVIPILSESHLLDASNQSARHLTNVAGDKHFSDAVSPQ